MVIDDSTNNGLTSIYSSQVHLGGNVHPFEIAVFGLDESEVDFGVEDFTEETVEVPEVTVAITDEHLRYLSSTVDPMYEDGNFGVNVYLDVLNTVSTWPLQ